MWTPVKRNNPMNPTFKKNISLLLIVAFCLVSFFTAVVPLASAEPLAAPTPPANTKVTPKPPTNTKTPINSTPKTTTSVVPGSITNQFAGKTLSGVVGQVINILLALIVIAAVVVIIVAGFRMAAGGGNPDQITKAKKTIIWAIVGLVIAFMSFAIVAIIRSLL